jgi:hypothetical protein
MEVDSLAPAQAEALSETVNLSLAPELLIYSPSEYERRERRAEDESEHRGRV